MKNLILVLVIAILGCEKAYQEPITGIEGSEKKLRFSNYESYHIREFEYDGCEYIAFGNGNNLTITHKGNCKYCQERGK